MQFDWWTFALQTINFAILVWLLHRFLYRPVLAAVDARRVEIDRAYTEAERARAEAEKQLAVVKGERVHIAEERETALKSAAAEAEQAAAARRAQAEREAAAVVAEGEKAIAGERRDALVALQHASMEFGARVARLLLEELPADYRADAWLDRLSSHIAGLSTEERERMAAGVSEAMPLRVVTAVPLPPATADKWRERLRAALGGDLAIVFDVDAELIAGVELHFPNAILRLSWQSQLTALRGKIEAP
jgi:F-type H+-transporting ATPase subunit b